MKNVCDGLISRLNIAKEKITEPENMLIKFPKVKCKHFFKKVFKETGYLRTMGELQKVHYTSNENTRRKEIDRNRINI